MILVSFAETLWYVFFISAGLLFLFCIIYFLVFKIMKKDEKNTKEFETDNFDTSNLTKKTGKGGKK